LGLCNGYFFGGIADAKLHAKTRCKIAMRFHTCDDVERSVRYFAVCGAVRPGSSSVGCAGARSRVPKTHC
jgi:hypothetical protein